MSLTIIVFVVMVVFFATLFIYGLFYVDKTPIKDYPFARNLVVDRKSRLFFIESQNGLGIVEASLNDLKSIHVVNDTVEKPEELLELAVQKNIKKGVVA